MSAGDGYRGRGGLVGYLFAGPYLVAYGALLVYPLLAGMALSLHKADLFGGREFVAFENYRRLVSDTVFRQAVGNTLYFTLLTVPALTVISLALALALNKAGRLAAFFRGVFFSSSVLSVTIVTLIWRFVLTPDGGLIANGLKAAGRAPIPFLSDPHLALPGIALTTVWWCLGLPMMLFLAGLQQIPGELYEAAALDGTSAWRTFWRITLPLIGRTLLVVVLIESVMQFQLFGQSQIMTQGGPNGASRPIVLFIYEVAFRRWDVGYAASASEVLFALILLASALQYAATRERRR
ncbi:MAG: sugar ABC transporter permease [Phenylobacterium sp.]|nr:MAG: sugar ABC transporter permease [Phenylobacterium sp.]